MTSTMAVLSSQTKSENATLFKNHKPLSSPSNSSTLASRSSSPTHLTIYGRSHSPPSRSLWSPYERPTPPGPSISALKKQSHGGRLVSSRKRTCVCSPTTHPGSFRCSLHKKVARSANDQTASCSTSRLLSYRRSAMLNSLVRIGGVEGEDLVRRSLSSPIRPSSHNQRRLVAFEPRPSRLSVMTKA
ncbi:uncharacterized protein LOC133796444 [Humulus lupulus]|uniref:uncharacterized protein LOC133796444 n=1 Tax=Humulus lupulus TaxID=3486 RepID=UPI002B418234|nr:uncharacterized protein LOC133796444 [Humulus lupulus]